MGPDVSLLRYVRGDAGRQDYAPDFSLQLPGTNLVGNGLLMSFGGKLTN